MSARGTLYCPGGAAPREREEPARAALWRGSDFLDLLADDHWIVAPNLLRAHLPVVEAAVVLVAVPVHGAEQTAASALETG